jgi:hypothetical protein
MKIPHSRYHWVAVAVAIAVLLLTLNLAHGQGTGSSAVFEGRPAMSGAQGGLGAQAGPPQGGIGLQGSDTRAPVPNAAPAPAAANAVNTSPPSPMDRAAKDVKPARDQSIAKDQRSVKKAKRAAKRTITRSRHGVSEIDSGSR